MRNFERSSLNRKMTIMAVITAAAALLVVFAAFAVTSVATHRKDKSMQLTSLAGVIGASSAEAFQLNNWVLARNTLRALQAQGDIVRAALYDRHGQLFASYRAGEPAVPAAPPLKSRTHDRATRTPRQDMGVVPGPVAGDDAPIGMDTAALAAANAQGSPFWSTRMRLYQPIGDGAADLGVVMIEADLSAMWVDIVASLGILAAALAGALLVVLVRVARFQRSMMQPVRQLILMAGQVAVTQDYSLRMAHRRTDELGTLIDSFNTMLAHIEDRGAMLGQHRDDLERQVGIRTAQLEKAKNAAEAASLAKSAFLATMSHEIRTPMNGVLGMTDMLLGTPLTGVQRDYTRLVKQSGEHLLVIINDILDFSKIEAGKLTVEYIDFNLWDLLDDIHTVYTPQAQAKHIGLDFDIANDIPVAICGDPNRLRQVIANLLGNAIKFTDTGRILATVRVASESAQAVALRFEVHDTGIGVASDARTRIFDAFSQADDSTTRKYGGTGLGLAISKQLVELMGGEIGVDSAMTQGALFWFTACFDKPKLERQAAPGLQGLRVLVIDEDAGSRAALARQLAGWQAAASCAGSALDGMAQLRAAAGQGQPFDAAIIDMALARTSGLALAAAITAEPATRATRLILISPNTLAADPVQRRTAGVAYQLTKPARDADLFACLATRAGGAAPATIATTLPPGVAAPLSAPAAPARAHAHAPARVATEADTLAAVAIRRHGAHPAASAPAHTASAPGAVRTSARPRILLAEDNPVNVEVARAMLTSLGLDVHCARDGAEALAALHAQAFDAVLMDCQMPVMDGFAATAAIRRMERDTAGSARRGRGRHLTIIAITANALQGDREACLAAGMDDYLSKPFSQQQLHAVVGQWIALPPLLSCNTAIHDAQPGPAPRGQEDGVIQLTRPARGIVLAGRTAPARSTTGRRDPAPGAQAGAVAAAQADAARTGGALINERALDAIRALSRERGGALVQKVVSTWVDATPQSLEALHLAIAAHDASGVRKVAHSLKSASANVGADSFAGLCRQLEQLGRNETTLGASSILNDMEREFQAVRRSLSSFLEKEI